jgi:hypothetical protein
MSEPRETKVQKTLAKIVKGRTDRELAFNPRTCEWVVVEKGERPSPDAQVATYAAKEGFFSSVE